MHYQMDTNPGIGLIPDLPQVGLRPTSRCLHWQSQYFIVRGGEGTPPDRAVNWSPDYGGGGTAFVALAILKATETVSYPDPMQSASS